MYRFVNVIATTLAITMLLIATLARADEQTSLDGSESDTRVTPATTPVEARARARLLHEVIRGSLQIMHRDFFDEDDSHAIPSASLEDVFHEMSKGYGINMKWLIVNTDVVNVDHQPETAFDRVAVKSLASGNRFVEQIDEGLYHFAGAIRLESQCLKCHVKSRTSNEARTAGFVITMPVVPRAKDSTLTAD